MKTQPPPEDRFHANVVKMTSLIKKIVVTANKSGYNEVTPFIIDLASKYIKNNYDKTDLIDNFIIHSHKSAIPTWDKILAKDETFFQENAFDIFQGLPSKYIETFKTLYNYKDPKTGEPIVNTSDKNAIINYFQAFVRICIRYIHAKRKPFVKNVTNEEGELVPKYFYGNSFMENVDVLGYARKWMLELEFSQKSN